MSLAPAVNPKGFISVTIGVPNISKNMCGYFWQINRGVFDISAQKIWVALYKGYLNIYPNPHDRNCILSIDTKTIADMIETEYKGLEISVDGVIIKRVETDLEGVKVFSELLWAWGDDASRTKALWRNALIHDHEQTHHQ